MRIRSRAQLISSRVKAARRVGRLCLPQVSAGAGRGFGTARSDRARARYVERVSYLTVGGLL